MNTTNNIGGQHAAPIGTSTTDISDADDDRQRFEDFERERANICRESYCYPFPRGNPHRDDWRTDATG
jgi:hypothetical protein